MPKFMENPNIAGLEYQRGTLLGFELREYLLQRDNHTCQYCGGASGDKILNIDHKHPRAKGGSDRLANLTLSCRQCNEDKNATLLSDWLIQVKKSKSKLNIARAKRLLGIIGDIVKLSGLPVTFWSGGRTKKNRTNQGYAKDHWIDAACVSESGERVFIAKSLKPILISATGHGSRQMCRVDKYGFQRTSAKKNSCVAGFSTGDIVKAVVPGGKNKGTYTGRIAVRASGYFNLKSRNIIIQGIKHQHCQILQGRDGYHYH